MGIPGKRHFSKGNSQGIPIDSRPREFPLREESDPSYRPNSVDYYCSKRLQGSTPIIQLNDCDKNVTM